MAKKILKFIDGVLDKIIMLFFILFFLIGVYGLADTYSVYSASQDKGLLKFKPEAGELLKPDITDNVAWLTIDDSTIDYPIMQGATNNDYLDKDPYGTYSLSGSIFLDCRNNPDFTDPFNLVYGHHMEKGLMFGSLDDWLDEDYFKSHKIGQITTANRIYKLHLYAVLEQLASVEQIFQPNDVSPSESIEYIKQNAEMKDDSVDPTHLVAFSTCKYPDTDDRTIVVFQMEQTYEGGNLELDQTKHKELTESQTQIGEKIYQNVKPIKHKEDWIDRIADWLERK